MSLLRQLRLLCLLSALVPTLRAQNAVIDGGSTAGQILLESGASPSFVSSSIDEITAYGPSQLVTDASSTITVTTGQKVNFYSGVSIDIKPGFHAVYGSTFHAAITAKSLLDPNGDADGDGIPNGWEESHGLNPLDGSDAEAQNVANDGMTNLQKYQLGLDPNQPATATTVLPAAWPNQANSTTSLVGYTSGSFSVDKSGSATYSIPIWVEPGVAGMQPKLFLNYSSTQTNGYLGVGWSLEGAPMISRRNANKATDGFIGPINMDANDRLLYDGQKLIAVSGSNGVDGTEYRTERESFARIYSHDAGSGASGFGPDHFTVVTKEGLTMEFGNTASSQMLSLGSGQSGAVLAWALDKVTDASGNSCTYSYSQDPTSGEFCLTKIDYAGGAEVTFTYEVRDDASSGYIGGAPWARTQRLKTITASYNSQTVRAVTLGYEYSPLTGRSRLNSVQENDANSASLPPINFSYKQETQGWTDDKSDLHPPEALSRVVQSGTGAINASAQGSGFVDLDGDGIPDFLYHHQSSIDPTPAIAVNVAALGTGSAWDSSFSNAAAFQSPLYLGADGQPSTGVRFVDLDGDGILDMIESRDYDLPGEPRVSAYLNTPTGWVSTGANWTKNPYSPSAPAMFTIAGSTSQDYGVRFVDLDGDGLVDVLWNGPNGAGALRNTGTGWDSFDPSSVNPSVSSSIYTNSFTPPAECRIDMDPADTIYDAGTRIIDLNGDGLPDIIRAINIYSGGNFVSNINVAYLNTGHGWKVSKNYSLPDFPPTYDSDGNEYIPYPQCIAFNGQGGTLIDFIDLNGDGLVDFINTEFGFAYLNTGSGWVRAPQYDPPKPMYAIGGYKPYTDNPWLSVLYSTANSGVALIDVNGDGLPDLVYKNDVDAGTFPLSCNYNSGYVYFNTGHGWSTDAQAAANPYALPDAFPIFEFSDLGAFPWYGFPTGVQFVDINGDRMVDVVRNVQWYNLPSGSGDSSFSQAVLNRSGKPDLLETVTASSGLRTTIAYKPITDKGGVYLPPSRGSSTFPVVDVRAPVYVVQSVTQDDGTGGQYTFDYVYQNFRKSHAEGDLGFEFVSVSDSRTGAISTTTYRQDYPYIGLAKDNSTVDSSGRLLEDSATTWDYIANATNARVRYPYPTTVVQSKYEPNDQSVPQTPFVTETKTMTCGSAGSTDNIWGDPVTITTSTSDDYSETETHTRTYQTAGAMVYPGQVASETVTVQAALPNSTSETRTKQISYDSAGRVQQTVIEPNDSTTPQQYYLATTYAYDSYGNIQTMTESSPALPADRVTSFEYSATYGGRFLTKQTDAENHVTCYSGYDQGFGVPLTTLDVTFGDSTCQTGLTTTDTIDTLGRITTRTHPDNTVTTMTRRWSSVGPANTQISVETLTDGAASKIEFYDGLNRILRTATVTGDGNIAMVDQAYNSRGLQSSETRPYFTGATAYSTTTSYDVLGRPYQVATPDGTFTNVYDGFVTTAQYPDVSTTPAQGVTYTRTRQKETTRNSQDLITKVVETGTANEVQVSSQIAYTYDPFGALNSTTDSANNVIAITTDLYGRQTQVADPDRGTWNYTYYPTGELLTQTDAKSQLTTSIYDRIGRITQRTMAGQKTTWTYDTATGWGKGQPASVSAPDNYSASYTYDAYGRTASATRVVEASGTPHTVNYTYDVFGRVSTVAYPGGFTRHNYYTPFGQLAQVSNDATQELYWAASSYEPDGQLDTQIFGNGLITERGYRPEDGLVQSIQTGPANSSGTLQAASVQNLSYQYESGSVGTLSLRQDLNQNVSERFVYDGLIRLSEVWSGQFASGAGTMTASLTYNAIGNIISKSDVGTYAYDPVRVHAVQSAAGTTYGYDANGNMTATTGSQVGSTTWKAWNQPDRITRNNAWVQFTYDAAFQRSVQTTSDGLTVRYFGADWEQTVTDGTTSDSFYIFSPLGRVVEVVWQNSAEQAVNYYHGDHLGSVDTITNADGQVVEQFSYDAWGKRRQSNWQAGSVTTTQRRGYTDHEMLDSVDLINMNGRVYDPVLGRFLSPDPTVQDIHRTQTYNTYAYVENNPLSTTDPTGFDDGLSDTTGPWVDTITDIQYTIDDIVYSTNSDGSPGSYLSYNTLLGNTNDTFFQNPTTPSYNLPSSPTQSASVGESSSAQNSNQIQNSDQGNGTWTNPSNGWVYGGLTLNEYSGIVGPAWAVNLSTGQVVHFSTPDYGMHEQTLNIALGLVGGKLLGSVFGVFSRFFSEIPAPEELPIQSQMLQQQMAGPSMKMTADQQALKELIDEATFGGREALTGDQANTILDWAQEVGYNGVRASAEDLSNPSNWTANPVPHIHFPGLDYTHIPVGPGVVPR